MSVRLAIPVRDSNGVKTQLAQHFGRAPYFAVVELDEAGEVSNLQIVPNKSEHFGGRGKPPEILINLNADAIVTYGMGTRAINMFQRADTAVLKTDRGTVEGVIEAYNKDQLIELTEGCHHAKHK